MGNETLIDAIFSLDGIRMRNIQGIGFTDNIKEAAEFMKSLGMEFEVSGTFEPVTLNFEAEYDSTYIPLSLLDEMIERVIYNEPATIVFWKSGEKTVVKAQDGEPFDQEKGLAMAIIKYLTGNTGMYNEIFKKRCE